MEKKWEVLHGAGPFYEHLITNGVPKKDIETDCEETAEYICEMLNQRDCSLPGTDEEESE